MTRSSGITGYLTAVIIRRSDMLGALLLAPLFFSIVVGVSRPRGDRLIAGVGVYATYLTAMTVLFGSFMLVNFLILSVLYGTAAVLAGHIWIERGRTFILLSDGTRYAGIWAFLWAIADFVGLAVVSYSVFCACRWLYSRSPLIRRLVCRVDQATNHKLLSR